MPEAPKITSEADRHLQSTPYKSCKTASEDAMALLLRRRLRCFYCGGRSKQKSVGGLQQWQCETCEAVNHLDENGEITDPPALEDTHSIRYAQTTARSVPPHSPDETLFCRACIKNQYFLTQALASYLPSPTDDTYPEFEKKYPEYRKGLEKRYPQVCDQCEPRVSNRIRVTGYTAKTDHLRRMMNNTRGSRSVRYGCNWRHFVAYGGALGSLTALVGQIVWNVFGAMGRSERELRGDTYPLLLSSCFRQSLRNGSNAVECAHLARPYATMALALGFLTIWWNPCLSRKIRGTKGRMLGLSEYYKLQAILNVTRLLAWHSLREDRGFHLDYATTKAVHAIMLVFSLVICFLSHRAAQIDPTPMVIFQDSPSPARVRKGTSSQVRPDTRMGAPPSNYRPSNSQNPSQIPLPAGQFPADGLATSPQGTYTSSYQPPTLPPDDEDGDEMDWTPVRDAFQPRTLTHFRQPTRIPVESFEHYKRLPAAPVSQERRLRNPSNQPRFRTASIAQQQKFFDRITSSVARESDDESETDFQGGHRNEKSNPMHRLNLASPSYLAQANLESNTGLETGLETLLSGVFSLADDPPEIRAERETREMRLKESQSPREGNSLQSPCEGHRRVFWQRIVIMLALGLACLAWSYAESCLHGAQPLRLAALGTAAVVAGRRLFDAFHQNMVVWKASDIMVLGLELTAVILFARNIALHGSQEDAANEYHGSGPMSLLALLFLQEFCAFSGDIRSSALHSDCQSSEVSSVHLSETGPILASQPDPGQTPVSVRSQVNADSAAYRTKQLTTHHAAPKVATDKYESLAPSRNLPGLSFGPGKSGRYKNSLRNEADSSTRWNI